MDAACDKSFIPEIVPKTQSKSHLPISIFKKTTTSPDIKQAFFLGDHSATMITQRRSYATWSSPLSSHHFSWEMKKPKNVIPSNRPQSPWPMSSLDQPKVPNNIGEFVLGPSHFSPTHSGFVVPSPSRKFYLHILPSPTAPSPPSSQISTNSFPQGTVNSASHPLGALNVNTVTKTDSPKSPPGTPSKVQVWSSTGDLIFEKHLKYHGPILNDGWFGSTVWSPDEKKIAYVSNSYPIPLSTKFEKSISTNGNDNDLDNGIPSLTLCPNCTTNSKHNGKNAGTASYDFQPDWGEEYSGTVFPSIWVLDITSGISQCVASGSPEWISTASTESPDVSTSSFHSCSMFSYSAFGQVSWLSNTSLILSEFQSNRHNKLGLIYCFQRQCNLVYCDFVSPRLIRINNVFHPSEEAPSKRQADNFSQFHPSLKRFIATTWPVVDRSSGFIYFLARTGPFYVHNVSASLIRFKFDTSILHQHENNHYSFDCVNIRSFSPEMVVNTVEKTLTWTDFPGIYALTLSPNFLKIQNEPYLLINSTWRSFSVILKVNLKSKKVSLLFGDPSTLYPFKVNDTQESPFYPEIHDSNTGKTMYSHTEYICNSVLDVFSNNILVHFNSRISSPSLQVLTSDATKSNLSVCGTLWTSPLDIPKSTMFVLPIPINNTKSKSKTPLEATIVVPENQISSKKVLYFIHGGPHSNYTCVYDAISAWWLHMGYSLVHLAYRGSTGFGKQFLNALPGEIGSVDVNDCIYLINTTVSLFSNPKFDAPYYISSEFASCFNPDQLFLNGGSHGGFLTTHLVSHLKTQTTFRAAMVRNPVINLVSMVGSTDIPDWVMVEGGCFDSFGNPSYTLTPERISSLYQKSPISKAKNVVTPVFIALGSADRRVPPAQGYEWARQLVHHQKGPETNCSTFGQKVKLSVYPTNTHRLQQMDAFVDVWLNTLIWFNHWSQTSKKSTTV